MENDERKNIIEIWKTIVGVQQHFNDIEMKIRGLFITVVVAVAAAQGFLIEKNLSFPIGSLKVLYAAFLPLIGIVATYLFYFCDRYWYHRLLMGAVLQGGSIENKYANVMPELGLGAKITEQSPVVLNSWIGRKIANIVVGDERYKNSGKLHSDAKIELFYKSVVFLFWLWFLFTVLFIGVFVGEHSLIEFLVGRLNESVGRISER